MFQTKVAEEIKTPIVCSITFPENRAVYEMTWKNMVGRDKSQITIWCLRISRWIPKATNTLSEYAVLLLFH